MSGLSRLTYTDWAFIGIVLEGSLYGIYSAIFCMYFQYQVSQKAMAKRSTIIFYSLVALYVLSAAVLTTDTWIMYHGEAVDGQNNQVIEFIATTTSGCCDFISQYILIYRCWIVWNRNVRVVTIPSILSIGFLALWLPGANVVVSNGFVGGARWENILTLTSIAMTLAVNALVTGLIVFRIFKVYCEVNPLYDQSFGNTGGSKLRPIIFVIIESGLALFFIQLAYIVAVLVQPENGKYFIIVSIQRMLNGLTPTIIQVRVSMGLSFHDQESMAEITSDLRFGSINNNQYSTPVTGDDINIDHQENRDVDICMKQCNEIDQEELGRDNDIVEVPREESIATSSPYI